MCVVSMVTDFYGNNYFYGNTYPAPGWADQLMKKYPNVNISSPPNTSPEFQTVEELLEFVRIIKVAHQYDIDNDEPNCPSPEKIKVLQAAVKAVENHIQVLSGMRPMNHTMIATLSEAVVDLNNIIAVVSA